MSEPTYVYCTGTSSYESLPHRVFLTLEVAMESVTLRPGEEWTETTAGQWEVGDRVHETPVIARYEVHGAESGTEWLDQALERVQGALNTGHGLGEVHAELDRIRAAIAFTPVQAPTQRITEARRGDQVVQVVTDLVELTNFGGPLCQVDGLTETLLNGERMSAAKCAEILAYWAGLDRAGVEVSDAIDEALNGPDLLHALAALAARTETRNGTRYDPAGAQGADREPGEAS